MASILVWLITDIIEEAVFLEIGRGPGERDIYNRRNRLSQSNGKARLIVHILIRLGDIKDEHLLVTDSLSHLVRDQAPKGVHLLPSRYPIGGIAVCLAAAAEMVEAKSTGCWDKRRKPSPIWWPSHPSGACHFDSTT